MFDFLFKRSKGKPLAAKVPDLQQQPDTQQNVLDARETALAQADALAGREAAAVEFILQCSYAEARFKAAHHVYSRSALEQVAKAVRNTDRRVGKLVQKRLDDIEMRETTARCANECIAQAHQLMNTSVLMPNQVADLDRAWNAIGNVDPSLAESFERIRAALRDRLEAQANLQRAVIDLRGKLQKLERAAIEAPHIFPHEKLLQSLDSLEQEMAQYRTHREAPSLPQQLLSDFAAQRDRFHATLAELEARRSAIAAREAALLEWEAAPPGELKEEALQRRWQALPEVANGDSALDARFDALLARVHAQRKPKIPASGQAKKDLLPLFKDTLEKMEQALEAGALHEAADLDKALRAIDISKLNLPEAISARLTRARAELHRLQGWARWGGNVSREELLKAAEELPAKQYAVAELAKKVGSLRERWKSLDGSAGPAAKEMWERFDAACTNAYAPVAAHFKKLAEERQHNLEQARHLIADVRKMADESHCMNGKPEEVDWRAVAAFYSRSMQAWQKLGPIDRKEKKIVDADFSAALGLLAEPLAAERRREIARREKLIAEASALDPADRRSIDALRALQERWQQQARSLPLERKDEQALWQRFRSACDTVFAKRKQAAHAADADRQSNLREKESLCATLEGVNQGSSGDMMQKMREIVAAWSKIGPVPRASERLIEQRFQAAKEALQKRIDEFLRSVSKERSRALQEKLQRCLAMEAMATSVGDVDDEELMRRQAEWQALPQLPSRWEQALHKRFDMAVNAWKAHDPLYGEMLQKNRPILEHEVLRLEIALGIDTPPEFSRDRLQLQVEVLQASLKSGQRPVSRQDQFLQMIELPAAADQSLIDRVANIAARMED